MALTVSEKQHWKERIARKISQAVEALLEKSNPKFLKEVAAAARREAPTRLGVVEVMNHLKHLDLEVKRIKGEEEDTVMQLLAIIRGVELKSVVMHFGWRDELDRALKKTQQALETEFLAADPLGRQVLKLRREEEELLDTVWLATSPQQIRDLWQSVAELLAGEVTPLQQKALTTPPLEGTRE